VIAVLSAAHIRSICSHAQELRVDERIQRLFAHGALESAEALNLFGPQAHVWHFAVLGTNPSHDLLVQACTHDRADRLPQDSCNQHHIPV
jgi:hypothetical protein